MKDWNKKERWALATKLHGIIGADLDADEEEAIYDAIRLICPEYAKRLDDDEQDAVDFFENATEDDIEKLKSDVDAIFDANSNK